MTKPDAPLTFRASDEDRKIVADLSKWLGLRMSQIVRLALRRLHDEESKRRIDVPSVTTTRKR
jgi:hypothetical protein